MNLLTRSLLAVAVLAVMLQGSGVAAEQPPSLDQRRHDMRARMLQARMARHDAYNKREYDFFHRGDSKKRA